MFFLLHFILFSFCGKVCWFIFGCCQHKTRASILFQYISNYSSIHPSKLIYLLYRLNPPDHFFFQHGMFPFCLVIFLHFPLKCYVLLHFISTIFALSWYVETGKKIILFPSRVPWEIFFLDKNNNNIFEMKNIFSLSLCLLFLFSSVFAMFL